MTEKWKIEDVPEAAIMRRKMGITSFFGLEQDGAANELRSDWSWERLKFALLNIGYASVYEVRRDR